jgi:hypothetical protein
MLKKLLGRKAVASVSFEAIKRTAELDRVRDLMAYIPDKIPWGLREKAEQAIRDRVTLDVEKLAKASEEARAAKIREEVKEQVRMAIKEEVEALETRVEALTRLCSEMYNKLRKEKE